MVLGPEVGSGSHCPLLCPSQGAPCSSTWMPSIAAMSAPMGLA